VNNTIDDSLLAGILPSDIEDYLRYLGWTELGRESSRYSLWRAPLEGMELEIPARSSLKDYRRRLHEIVHDLSDSENRSVDDVVTALSKSWSDLFSLRLADNIAEYGTIPVSSAIIAFEQLKNMLSSAARSAVNPRNAYAARPPAEVLRYLREARFAQTRPGSYIINVVSPLRFAQADRRLEPVPFSRRALATLATGLTRLRLAAEYVLESRNHVMTPFSDVVAEGVSANLCDAVLKTAAANLDGVVEAHFGWSFKFAAARPAVSSFVMPRNVLPIIRAASEYLKELEPEPEFELRGFVYRLEDIKNDEHSLRATVAGIVGDAERSVEFLVPQDARQAAWNALDHNHPIRCVGTLDRRPRPYVLTDVSGFMLTESAPTFDPESA
jgi:hypothetical protein